MNNFKGSGGFNKGGNKFGNKPKFGGSDRNGGKSFRGGDKFSGGKDRSSGNSEQFKATCSECHSACTVPFRPSGDKPVYCSNCFGRKRSDDNRVDQRGGRDSKPNYDKAPRDQRPPRHEPRLVQVDPAIADIKRQIVNLEVKLNRILEIINPPVPSQKVPLPENTDGPKKDRKPKKEKVVKKLATKVPRKVATKKKVVKKVAKKTTKKTAKKK